MDVRLPIGKVAIKEKAPATLLGNLALVNEAGGQTELTATAPSVIDNGFDIVIGNPPYGIKFASSVKKSLSRLYPLAARVPDSYAFFILRGLELFKTRRCFGDIARIRSATLRMGKISDGTSFVIHDAKHLAERLGF